MRLIIAGSRNLAISREDMHAGVRQFEAAHPYFGITELVAGGSGNVDRMAEVYARDYGLPIKVFMAEWARLGKSAGPARNRQMANYADAGLIFWDGQSRGAANMHLTMQVAGKPVLCILRRPLVVVAESSLKI